MKKKFFLVGALVVMSMSAMFVACNQNTPTNGCKCTFKHNGETDSNTITLAEMKEYYNVTSCGALASAVEKEAKAAGESISVSCSAY